MARTIWKGSLSFGLVNVPIGVYPATQDKSIHFNQFERGTSDRIRYKKVNERTGKEVESGNIVKGVDLGAGEYVILSEDELAAAEPERSRYIEITDFVSLNEIDPVYFNTTYYLAPEGETAGKAYALLRQAMQDSGKVAIATFVMRNKEYLVAIRPEADVLALETMSMSSQTCPTAKRRAIAKSRWPNFSSSRWRVRGIPAAITTPIVKRSRHS
jgi:DNA end-binding protein Ku